ncbi:MAG TPA: PTS fructose transporter subunit IIA [Methylophilaceae bacterium]|nr:PTS fructose transporter subunit IIA [Methylophilaceae bacterium]
MIGILIVAHGTLGESLIHCASHVMGTRPPQLQQLGVSIHDDPVKLLPHAQLLIKELDQGQGVLILSDIYGATPCNVVCKLLEPGRVEGVAGVNLPMLVRVLTYRNGSLAPLVEKAVSGGQEGVLHFTPEACPK